MLCKGVVVEIKKGNNENKSQVDQVARQRSSKNFGELHHLRCICCGSILSLV